MSTAAPPRRAGLARPPGRRRGPGPAWWRAPVALLGTPGLAAALLAAVALLALATAASPLLVRSAGDAAFADALAGFEPEAVGFDVVAQGELDGDDFAAGHEALAEGAAALGLAEPTAMIEPTDDHVAAQTPAGETVQINYEFGGFPVEGVQLLGRTGITDHLPGATEPAGDGLWVPRDVAAALEVEPGDTFPVHHGGRAVDVPVAGLYQDPFEFVDALGWSPPDPLPPGSPAEVSWRPLRRLVVQAGTGEPTPMPPPVVGEPEDLAAVGDGITLVVDTRWTVTNAEPITDLDGAQQLLAAHEQLRADVVDPGTELGAGLAQTANLLHTRPEPSSMLSGVLDEPAERTTALAASVAPVDRAAQLLALAAVAGTAVFLVLARRSELTHLAAQGMGGAWIGTRTLVEALGPAVVGGGVGVALAAALTAAVGPAGLPSGEVIAAAAGRGAAAVGVGLLLLVVVTVVLRPRPGRSRGAGTWRRTLSRLPWELVLVGLAGLAGVVLAQRGSLLVTGAGAPGRVDPLAVAFPLLVVAAVAALVVRALGWVAPRLQRSRRPRGVPALLALRRVVTASAAARALVAAAAVGMGTLVFAAVMAASVAQTVDAKVAAASGAPTAVPLGPRQEIGGEAGVAITDVARRGVIIEPSGAETTLLGIDADTFADVASWHPSFADRPLETLLDAVGQPHPEAVPAVAVGLDPAATDRLTTPGATLPIEVVGTAAAFPGLRGGSSALVVDTEAFAATADAAGAPGEAAMLRQSREAWLAEHDDDVIAQLSADPLAPSYMDVREVRTADDIGDRSELLAATWALGHLRAVGIVAALVGLVAVGAAIASRSHQRAAATALTSRMGLSRRGQRRAAAGELTGLVLLALLAGVGPALLAGWLVARVVDPAPDLPPEPLVVLPGWWLAGVVLVALATALVGGWLADRRAHRTDAAAVLRAGP